jgi:hypothetical protein
MRLLTPLTQKITKHLIQIYKAHSTAVTEDYVRNL